MSRTVRYESFTIEDFKQVVENFAIKFDQVTRPTQNRAELCLPQSTLSGLSEED